MHMSVVYAAVAAIAVSVGVRMAGPTPVLPLVVSSPLVLVYLFFDTRKRSKKLVPEMAGPLGLAGVAPAIALAGGLSGPGSWALWAVMAARTIPSILYVRARLRLRRGEETNRIGVIGWHFGSLMLIGALAREGHVPLLTAAALVVLLVRAGYGLSPNRQRSKVTRIGFLEIAYGLFYIIATGVGYRMNI
jgi:hypothetical protein